MEYIYTQIEYPFTIDGKEIQTQNALSKYLKRIYNITFKEWYIKNYLNGENPKCSREGCNNEVAFDGRRFKKYCSCSCHIIINNSSEKHIKSVKKALNKPSVKKKMSNKAIKRWSDLENRKKQSSLMAEIWIRPNEKEKRITGMKNWRKDNPEKVERLRQKLSIINKSTEGRRKNSKGMKLAYKNDPTLVQRTAGRTLNIVNSKLEKITEKYLQGKNINYIRQYFIEDKCFDFYLPDLNAVIEVDGSYFHPMQILNGLNKMQLSNIINDKIKDDLAINKGFSIYRLRIEDDLLGYDRHRDNENTYLLDTTKDLKQLDNCYYYDANTKENTLKYLEWNYGERLMDRQYLLTLTLNKKEEVANLLLQYIRTFMKFEDFFELPDIEKLKKDIERMKRYNRNENSMIKGSEYKKWFPNIYETINNYSHKDKCTKDIFYDDELLLNVLRYRVGLNKSKLYTYKLSNGTTMDAQETFHITKGEIITGINSYYRSTPSLFNPETAYFIYKRYTNSGDNVYDLSAGFGGRLVGAIAADINYYGTDPNSKTYENLLKLKDDMEGNGITNGRNIVIYNECSEHLIIKDMKFDFIFSSIPYFDTEIYCKEETQCYNKFNNIDEWINGYLIPTLINCKTMIKDNRYIAININKKYRNVVLNTGINVGLVYQHSEFIKNNISHFSKKTDTNKEEILFFT